MYCTVMGSDWPRLFFVLFWIVTVLIFLNIIITFVLEIYNSVGEEIAQDYKRRNYIQKLKFKFENNQMDVTSEEIFPNLGFDLTHKLEKMSRARGESFEY